MILAEKKRHKCHPSNFWLAKSSIPYDQSQKFRGGSRDGFRWGGV